MVSIVRGMIETGLRQNPLRSRIDSEMVAATLAGAIYGDEAMGSDGKQARSGASGNHCDPASRANNGVRGRTRFSLSRP